MAKANVYRFAWAGQGLAVDLADTVVTLRRGVELDLLETREQLAHWLELERDVVGAAGDDVLDRLTDFRRVRGAVRTCLFAAVSGKPMPPDAVATLNAASEAVPTFVRLDPTRSMAVQETPAADGADRILAEIARSAIELLGGPERERLRVCVAPSCGMLYLATSARRRWCSDACGNRARVARHYARTRRAA